MKKLLLGLLAASSVFTASVFADDSIGLVVNGEKLTFDQPPVIIDNRTLVPIRAISEGFGAQVDWDYKTKTVTCSLNDTVIKLEAGSKTMIANGEEITLDVPPTVINQRTLVPIRAISEGFGAQVKWDSLTKTVYADFVTTEKAEKVDYTTEYLTANVTKGNTVVVPINISYPKISVDCAANEIIKADVQKTADRLKKDLEKKAMPYYDAKSKDRKEKEAFGLNWYAEVSYEVKYLTPLELSSKPFISIYKETTVSTIDGLEKTPEGLNIFLTDGQAVDADSLVPGSYGKMSKAVKALVSQNIDETGKSYSDFKLPPRSSYYFSDGAVVYVMPSYGVEKRDDSIFQYKVEKEIKKAIM